METSPLREKRFAKINRIFFALYLAFCAVLIAAYAVRKDGYHLIISLGAPLVLPALALFYKVFGLKRVQQLDFLIVAFTFLAYPLGSCLDLYRILPGFDKAAHCLSGVFVSILCLVLYYALKPGHAIEKSDAALAIAFTFFGSMAVAGLWEISEYVLSGIVKIDLQRVLTTSVSDSMLDMIVCLIGTLVTLPFVKRLCDGKRDILTGAAEAFVELNLKEGSK